MNADSRSSILMRRESLRSFFESSPTTRLLRSDMAPLILDFLNRTFKSGETISIGQSELRARLLSYQEDLHAVEPEIMLGPAERYLSQWAEAGWLKRFVDASSPAPLFQLTQYAEEALRFVDSALARRKSLVGTESRLRLVIDTLEDIVRGASSDADRRLEHLRAQRDSIDHEIRSIESGKSVQTYRPAQIRERFQTAIDLLKGLQSDFRAVEERFQQIAREVQQLQSSGSESRGGILGFALDSEDMLKRQDEGISFFAFVSFLFSPTQQHALRKNIEELQQMEALVDQHESLYRVRRMVPALLAEADKVMRTTARLSTTLRRLLDARAAAHRMRLSQVLRDIRHAAIQLRNFPPEELSITVDTQAELVSPLTRPFWTGTTHFSTQTLAQHTSNFEQATRIATAFARLQRLDYRKLRSKIRESTFDGTRITLAQLLASEPADGGIVELLGYIQVAHDDGHEIDPMQSDSILVRDNQFRDRSFRVTVPRVTYIPKSVANEMVGKPR